MKTFFGCLLLVAMAVCSPARAESLEHVDRLAVEVRERANLVCWEMFQTGRFRPDYAQVYRDAKEVWSIAGHIHDLVHNSGNLDRIQRNAAELNMMLGKVRMGIAQWDNGFQGPHQPCTFALKQRLAGLEQAVQHLMSDVGVPSQMPMPNSMGGQPMMPSQQMMSAGPGPMMQAGPGQMPMPSQVGSFFPGSPMPQPQMMAPSGYPQGPAAGVPNGYNPQAGMSFFPGMGR